MPGRFVDSRRHGNHGEETKSLELVLRCSERYRDTVREGEYMGVLGRCAILCGGRATSQRTEVLLERKRGQEVPERCVIRICKPGC